jgi:hypothetical protein
MTRTVEAKKSWTRPALVRIGTIAAVQASQSGKTGFGDGDVLIRRFALGILNYSASADCVG